MTRLLAILVLALAVGACRPSSTEQEGAHQAEPAADAVPAVATTTWTPKVELFSDLARAIRLVAAQAAPTRRAEEARTAAAGARARLAAARAHLFAKGATLAGRAATTEESYRLAAPFAGTVVEAKALPGAHVEVGTPLFRVVELRRVWVEGRAPEADANRIAAARFAVIEVPGGDDARKPRRRRSGARPRHPHRARGLRGREPGRRAAHRHDRAHHGRHRGGARTGHSGLGDRGRQRQASRLRPDRRRELRASRPSRGSH